MWLNQVVELDPQVIDDDVLLIPAAFGYGWILGAMERALKRQRLRKLEEKLQRDLYGPQCGAGLIGMELWLWDGFFLTPVFSQPPF